MTPSSLTNEQGFIYLLFQERYFEHIDNILHKMESQTFQVNFIDLFKIFSVLLR